jgi:hypothetical protein
MVRRSPGFQQQLQEISETDISCCGAELRDWVRSQPYVLRGSAATANVPDQLVATPGNTSRANFDDTSGKQIRTLATPMRQAKAYPGTRRPLGKLGTSDLAAEHYAGINVRSLRQCGCEAVVTTVEEVTLIRATLRAGVQVARRIPGWTI